MANTLYKALVRELETVLAPRVVSQALHEGLAALGKSADTLLVGDVETLLLQRVLPRLSPSLGAEGAQDAVRAILGRVSQRAEPPLPDLPPDLEAQTTTVRDLREALKPFNIYFEWSETQKLRAQLSLIETEHAAERDAGALIAAARLQLGVLQRKLDDQLAVQARELVLLEAAQQSSSALSTPKVRRLAQLLDLIRSAQEARQRAPAEVERAHKLAGELRAEKLRLLSEEARELRGLFERFSTLLALEPALAERLSSYQQQLDAETLLAKTLSAFRHELESTEETLRQTLQTEFRELLNRTQNPELAQLLTLSLKVLETTLPPVGDVQRAHDLVRAKGVDGARLADFHRLEAEAESYRDLPNALGEALGSFLRETRRALEETRVLPELHPGWALLEQAQSAQARSAQDFGSRLAAAQGAAAPLLTLNSAEAAELRGHLQVLQASAGDAPPSPKQQAEREAHLREVERLSVALTREAEATRAVAAELFQGGLLDEMLGLRTPTSPAPASPALEDNKNDEASTTPAPPPPPQAPARAPTPQERAAADLAAQERAEVQRWLEERAGHPGVAGLALYTEADTLVAGELPTDPKTLGRAVRLTRRRADALGAGLAQGAATTLSVETPGRSLIVFWLAPARSLVLITRAPSWSGTLRRGLEEALPELSALLEGAEMHGADLRGPELHGTELHGPEPHRSEAQSPEHAAPDTR